MQESFDINKLTLRELRRLKKRVEKKINILSEQEKIERARSTIEAKAKQLGFTLSELASETKERRKHTVRPKYRNPDDHEQMWSGRGRKPHWVAAALESGKSLDDLIIK